MQSCHVFSNYQYSFFFSRESYINQVDTTTDPAGLVLLLSTPSHLISSAVFF